MITWCDPTEAKDLTNRDVTQNMLDDAQPIINMFSGITPETRPASTFTTSAGLKDLLNLKYALVYQAQWMADQIDTFNRMDVSKILQDGMSFEASNDNSMILSPHARVCLNRIRRSVRTLRPRAGTARAEAPMISELPHAGWSVL